MFPERVLEPRNRVKSFSVTWLGIVACSLVLVCNATSRAEDAEAPRSKWTTSVGVEEGYTSNVRWAGTGSEKESAYFTTVEGRFGREARVKRDHLSHLGLKVRGRFYDRFSERDFVEIRPDAVYRVGDTELLLRYAYVPRKLELDDPVMGNVHKSVHAVESGLQRKFGPGKAFRIRALVEMEWERSKTDFDDRDALTVGGSVDLRYRVHELFTPRVALGYAERDANNENFDREERELVVGFDSHWTDRVYSRVRFKRANRKYTVNAPVGPSGSNNNFQREDDINQVEVGVAVECARVPHLSFDAGYKYRDSQSTRTSRTFDVHEARVGVTYRFR